MHVQDHVTSYRYTTDLLFLHKVFTRLYSHLCCKFKQTKTSLSKSLKFDTTHSQLDMGRWLNIPLRRGVPERGASVGICCCRGEAILKLTWQLWPPRSVSSCGGGTAFNPHGEIWSVGSCSSGSLLSSGVRNCLTCCMFLLYSTPCGDFTSTWSPWRAVTSYGFLSYDENSLFSFLFSNSTTSPTLISLSVAWRLTSALP